MDNWSVKFETHTRKDVMKICAILARGIDAEQLANNRIKVRIDGDANAGKSAVSDGLIAALAHDLSSYELSQESLIEKHPCEATLAVLRKTFIVHDLRTVFTMYHDARYKEKNSFFNIKNIFQPLSRGGIDFRMRFDRSKQSEGDLSIFLKRSYGKGATHCNWKWGRNWEIAVNTPSLRTTEMAEALDHLRNFHTHRQARVSKASQEKLAFESQEFG